MKKILLFWAVSAFLINTNAQVKDISFTLSPAVSYHWWNDQSGLADDFLYGGQIGFGFGENIELRGVYFQSDKLMTSFEKFGLPNYMDNLFISKEVDFKRYGGQFKANIGTNELNPYITLGTGVQSFKVENMDIQKQIYADLGLGIKYNIGKRTSLNIEGKNTMYNFNAVNRLLDPQNVIDFAVTPADYGNERLNNWSVMASLQFYLGGRQPGELSELDKAYLNTFKSGFSGIRWTIEPSGSYLEFKDENAFRNTYLLGGYAGLDFNEFVGVRGFYFRATEDNSLSLNFDNLSMYGGEFRARLNIARGVTPYIALGGGYLNPFSSYVPQNTTPAEGKYFAHGGLGLNIPLSNEIQLFGSMKYLLTSSNDPEDLVAPDEISAHTWYSFGVKFLLGKKSNDPVKVYESQMQSLLNQQQLENEAQLAEIKEVYEIELAALNDELLKAYEEKNMDKAVEVLKEKKEIEKSIEKVVEIEKLDVPMKTKEINKLETPQVIKKEIINQDGTKVISKETLNPDGTKEISKETINRDGSKVISKEIEMIKKSDTKEEMIRMTPQEFENLIKTILREVNDTGDFFEPSVLDQSTSGKSKEVIQLENQIKTLEKALLIQNNSNLTPTPTKDSVSTTTVIEKNENSDNVLEILAEMQKQMIVLNKKVDAKTLNDIDKPKTIVKNVDGKEIIQNVEEDYEYYDDGSAIYFKGLAPVLGVGFGDQTTFNVGIRGFLPIGETRFEIMPEFTYGFGDSSLWNLSGNIIYPINLNKTSFIPYVGTGVGLTNVSGDSNFDFNLILGSKLDVLNNSLFLDFTAKTFKNYQLMVGYRYDFK